MSENILINIHSIIPFSKVNGPGNRMVIFFQGCTQNCTGCFNPETHTLEKVILYTPEDIFKKHLKPNIDGITISGGEPFRQEKALLHLLKIAKEYYNLSTIVYTGFIYENLKNSKISRLCLKYIDLLIDGKYDESKKENSLLPRGSTNQRFLFLTDKFQLEDLYMTAKVEVHIATDGTIIKTGFNKANSQDR